MFKQYLMNWYTDNKGIQFYLKGGFSKMKISFQNLGCLMSKLDT